MTHLRVSRMISRRPDSPLRAAIFFLCRGSLGPPDGRSQANGRVRCHHFHLSGLPVKPVKFVKPVNPVNLVNPVNPVNLVIIKVRCRVHLAGTIRCTDAEGLCARAGLPDEEPRGVHGR